MRKEDCWSFVFFSPPPAPPQGAFLRLLVSRVVSALWSAVLSFLPALPWVRDPYGLQAGRLQPMHDEQQEGNSLSSDQAAELQPLQTFAAQRLEVLWGEAHKHHMEGTSIFLGFDK